VGNTVGVRVPPSAPYRGSRRVSRRSGLFVPNALADEINDLITKVAASERCLRAKRLNQSFCAGIGHGSLARRRSPIDLVAIAFGRLIEMVDRQSVRRIPSNPRMMSPDPARPLVRRRLTERLPHLDIAITCEQCRKRLMPGVSISALDLDVHDLLNRARSISSQVKHTLTCSTIDLGRRYGGHG
jgi:hypothetical protein